MRISDFGLRIEIQKGTGMRTAECGMKYRKKRKYRFWNEKAMLVACCWVLVK